MTISREEAIKIQQTKVEGLKLDIRQSDIDIGKLEKKVNKEVIYSKLDGTIAKVGDPVTGVSDGNAFMTIKSKEGYYVKGTVSELLLDKLQEGTILNCPAQTEFLMQRLWMYLSIRYRMRFTEQAWEIQMFLIILTVPRSQINQFR